MTDGCQSREIAPNVTPANIHIASKLARLKILPDGLCRIAAVLLVAVGPGAVGVIPEASESVEATPPKRVDASAHTRLMPVNPGMKTRDASQDAGTYRTQRMAIDHYPR